MVIARRRALGAQVVVARVGLMAAVAEQQALQIQAVAGAEVAREALMVMEALAAPASSSSPRHAQPHPPLDRPQSPPTLAARFTPSLPLALSRSDHAAIPEHHISIGRLESDGQLSG